MTPERLKEIRSRSFKTTPLEGNIGFSGLSSDEAQELIEAVIQLTASNKGKDAEIESLLDDVRGLMSDVRGMRASMSPAGETVLRMERERDRLVDKYRRLVSWLKVHKVGGWESAVED